MSVERIVDKLAADAAAEARALLDKARERAAEAAAAAEREAAAARQAVLNRAARDAEAARRRVVTEARLQARALVAQARRDALEEVFRAARQALADLPAAEYRGQLLAALAAVAAGTEEVVLSPRDREALGPWLVEQANARLGGSLRLAEETRPLAGGFILLAGPVEVNVSLDVVLEGLRDDLEPEVAGVLFGGREG